MRVAGRRSPPTRVISDENDHYRDPSVSKHLSVPNIAFARCPSAHRASHSAFQWVWASPLTCRLAEHSGRIEFVILRTGLSPPVASHPRLSAAQFLSVSGRRTYA